MHRDIENLEEAKVIEDFPTGYDSFMQRHWLTNAIDCGSIKSIKWVLSHNINLTYRDEDGYTPLLSALERTFDDKYEILQLLIESGAPINLRGINDYTPLHFSAIREDIQALKILINN